MKFYFGVTAITLLLAAGAGGAMLWDGSYYLYCTLNAGHVCIPNNRWINLFLHYPALVLSDVSQNIHILRLVFGLTYALIPLGVLALSWWIVRKTAPSLFVWAAFGIGFGTLLLQLHFVSEAIISVQLTWPILLAQLVPGRRAVHLSVVILAVLLLVSHPFAIGSFILVGMTAVVVGWRIRALRREKWVWGLIWIGLTILACVRLLFASSAYEAERISLSVFQEGLGALRGLPGFALLSCLSAAIWVFLSLREKIVCQSNLEKWAREGQIAGLMLTTIFLVMWASNPISWNSSFSYRVIAPIVSLPFFCLAGLDGILSLKRVNQDSMMKKWNWLLISQTISVSFALILCVQSWSWYRVQNQLAMIIAESPTPCISLREVADRFGEGQMPFQHWTITVYSILIQGAVPEKVIMEKPCDGVDFSNHLPLSSWENQNWTANRIFDLSHLENKLR
jgi:hypothetical protein